MDRRKRIPLDESQKLVEDSFQYTGPLQLCRQPTEYRDDKHRKSINTNINHATRSQVPTDKPLRFRAMTLLNALVYYPSSDVNFSGTTTSGNCLPKPFDSAGEPKLLSTDFEKKVCPPL